MADIFVSYSRQDRARVAPLVAALEAQRWSVWWDPEITPGQEFDRRISAELDGARAVIVVWSPLSVDSRWVRGEAREAADRGVLVPVRFENARLPIDARAVHTIDLDNWGGNPASDEFRSLTRALGALLGSARVGGEMRSSADEAESLSIAVLPFVNMSADSEQEYFSDGLSEELINQLAHLRNLRVAGRTSCFAFKGKADDLRLVGNKLGVNHVLEGSVRKAGSRLRITAQLVKCRDGFHLWSETYDRQLDDVFAIQEDVARCVARELGVALGIGEGARAPGGTTNMAAYDLYLRGKALRNRLAPQDVRRAIETFRKTVALDPDFGLAWAALGEAIAYSLIYYRESYAAAVREMDDALTRAVRLAPGVPEIYTSLGLRCLFEYDWIHAEEHFAARLRIGVDTSGHAGMFLGICGRLQEALVLAIAARQVEPLSSSISFGLQLMLEGLGRFDEAEAEYERSIDLGVPGGVIGWRAITRMLGRKDARFKQRYREYVAGGLSWMPFDAQLLEALDDTSTALGILRTAYDDPVYQDGPRMCAIATWAAHFGDLDLAFMALRRGLVQFRSLTLVEIWLPAFREVRRDPRFKQILRDIGLADHWRRTGKWGEFARPAGDSDFEIVA